MLILKVAGALLLVHASFAAIQLILSLEKLRQSSEAFAAPDSPYSVFLGFVGLNALMIGSAGALGGYLLRVQQPQFKYVLPLALLTALYGGLGLVVGIGALGICIVQKVRLNEI